MSKSKKAESKFCAYQAVTDAIIAKLESGVCPWRKSWQTISGKLPTNAVSGNEYRGINQMLLGWNDFADHRWVTFLQAQQLGGHVKKGEKSSIIAFYKSSWDKKIKDEESGEIKKVRVELPVLSISRVFNVAQCEGLKIEPLQTSMDLRTDAQRCKVAEDLIADYLISQNLKVCDSQAAWYRPSDDMVGMPSIAQFDCDSAFYATFLHELTHSTGHCSRLNRKGVNSPVRFGSETYSEEELVAELGSAFLMNRIGLECPDSLNQSAAYLKGWIAALKGDSRLLIRASSAATKAANLIASEVAA